MKHRIYFLILFSFLFSFCSSAQQYRFVYIQTENKQPFYVKINGMVLSSSSSGYLIIPKLIDGTYQLNIGFPKNEWPQQTVTIAINKKDAGFLLKNFGDKGWGLFNLQTMEVLMAKGTETKVTGTADMDNDPFTQVLSDVVNTPELKKKTVVTEPVVVAKAPEPEKTQVVVKKEEQVIKKEEPVVQKEEPVVKVVAEEKPAGIRTLVNHKNDNGRDLVYIDEATNDTIRIFIPASEPMVTTAAVKKKTRKTEEKKSNEKFMDIELPNPNAKNDTTVRVIAPSDIKQPVVTEKEKKVTTVSMVNSDCKANASDDDFLKLRKKMAAAKTDEEMVAVAKKAFKSRCYSTAQVKNLSVLFLNDAGRYQFFDAAYPFVYDSVNFSTLQEQLTDPYFITRFQAMIRK